MVDDVGGAPFLSPLLKNLQFLLSTTWLGTSLTELGGMIIIEAGRRTLYIGSGWGSEVQPGAVRELCNCQQPGCSGLTQDLDLDLCGFYRPPLSALVPDCFLLMDSRR